MIGLTSCVDPVWSSEHALLLRRFTSFPFHCKVLPLRFSGLELFISLDLSRNFGRANRAIANLAGLFLSLTRQCRVNISCRRNDTGIERRRRDCRGTWGSISLPFPRLFWQSFDFVGKHCLRGAIRLELDNIHGFARRSCDGRDFCGPHGLISGLPFRQHQIVDSKRGRFLDFCCCVTNFGLAVSCLVRRVVFLRPFLFHRRRRRTRGSHDRRWC